MANIKARDADNQIIYIGAGGQGTDADPYIRQLSTTSSPFAVGAVQTAGTGYAIGQEVLGVFSSTGALTSAFNLSTGAAVTLGASSHVSWVPSSSTGSSGNVDLGQLFTDDTNALFYYADVFDGTTHTTAVLSAQTLAPYTVGANPRPYGAQSSGGGVAITYDVVGGATGLFGAWDIANSQVFPSDGGTAIAIGGVAGNATNLAATAGSSADRDGVPLLSDDTTTLFYAGILRDEAGAETRGYINYADGVAYVPTGDVRELASEGVRAKDWVVDATHTNGAQTYTIGQNLREFIPNDGGESTWVNLSTSTTITTLADFPTYDNLSSGSSDLVDLKPVRYNSQSATPGVVKAYGLIGYYDFIEKVLYNQLVGGTPVTIGVSEDDAIASSIMLDATEGEQVAYYTKPALQSEIVTLNSFTQGALGVDATLQIDGLTDPREIAGFAKARVGDVPGTTLFISNVGGTEHGYYEIFGSTGGANPTLTVRRLDTSANLFAQPQAADSTVFNAGSIVQIRTNILQDSFYGPNGITLPAGAKFCKISPIVTNLAIDEALADPAKITEIKQINVRCLYWGHGPMHFSKEDVITPQSTLREGDVLYLTQREAISFECWGIGSSPNTVSLTVEWLDGTKEACNG